MYEQKIHKTWDKWFIHLICNCKASLKCSWRMNIACAVCICEHTVCVYMLSSLLVKVNWKKGNAVCQMDEGWLLVYSIYKCTCLEWGVTGQRLKGVSIPGNMSALLHPNICLSISGTIALSLLSSSIFSFLLTYCIYTSVIYNDKKY